MGQQDKDLYALKKPQGLPSAASQSSQAVIAAAPDLMLVLFWPPLQMPRTVLGLVSI